MQAARLTPFPKAAPVEGKNNPSLFNPSLSSTNTARTIIEKKNVRDAGDGVSSILPHDGVMRAEKWDLRTRWEHLQYYLEKTDNVKLPTVGYRDDIPEQHRYRYLWVRDTSRRGRVTGVLMATFNLQEIEET
jgi:hypothetical protein